MSKFVDFYSDREVQDIMEAFVDRFPMMFEGFDSSKMGFVTTKAKKGKKGGPVLKLHKVGYPHNVWLSKAYIVEAQEGAWRKLDDTKKNLSVFKIMCAIPIGGFDEQSKSYGKVLQPDIKMFMREYAASGGVVNWQENPAALDPMKQTAEDVAKAIPVVEAIPADDGVERKAVTADDVISVKPTKAAAAPVKK
jgi:hypothetical protein